MRHSRRIGAFFSGLALYSVAVFVSWQLAELRLPQAVLSLLGGRDSVGLLLGEALVYALPVFVLALSWSYLTVRPQRRGRNPTTAWCLAGLCLAWFCWLVYGGVVAANDPYPRALNLGSLLLSSLVPPLWGTLNTVAALVGVLLAGLLAKRRISSLQG